MVLQARGERLGEAWFHVDRAVSLDGTDLEAHVLRVSIAEERGDEAADESCDLFLGTVFVILRQALNPTAARRLLVV